MEWNVADYKHKCFTASPEEDSQEGDLRRDSGRPQQATRSITGKEEKKWFLRMFIGLYILCGIFSIKSQELFELACCEESYMLLDSLLFTQKSYKWNSCGGPKGRSVETDFSMKETIPATCSLSQIFPPRSFLSPMAQQPPLGQSLLIIEASPSQSDIPHSVGLLWTGDQNVAKTSTRQNTILTRGRHSRSLWDSYRQSQQASGRRTKP
jgi:hypothetical protein